MYFCGSVVIMEIFGRAISVTIFTASHLSIQNAPK